MNFFYKKSMLRGKKALFFMTYAAFFPRELIYFPKRFIIGHNPKKNTHLQVLINNIMELKKSKDQNNQRKKQLIYIKENLCDIALNKIALPLNEKNDLKFLLNNTLNTINENDFESFSSIFSFIIRNYFDCFQEINNNMLNLAINNVKNSNNLNEFLVANYFITLSKACKTRFFSKELWEVLNEKIVKNASPNYNEYSDHTLISIFYSYCEILTYKNDENLVDLNIIKKICYCLYIRSNDFSFNKWKDYLKSLSMSSIFGDAKEEVIFYEKLWPKIDMKTLDFEPKTIILTFHYMVKIGISINFHVINNILEKIWLFKNEIKKNQDIAILLAGLTKIQYFEEFQTNITKINNYFYPYIKNGFSKYELKSKIDFIYSFCNSTYHDQKLMEIILRQIALSSLIKYDQLIGTFCLDLKKKYPELFEKQKPLILNFFKKNPTAFNNQNFGAISLAFIKESDGELFNLFENKISQITACENYFYLPEYMNYFEALSTKKFRILQYDHKQIFMKCMKFLQLTTNFIKDTKIKKNEFYFHTIINFYKNELHNNLESESQDLFFKEFFEGIKQGRFLNLASQKQIYLICEALFQISDSYQEKIKKVCIDDLMLNKDLKEILEKIVKNSLNK